MPLPIGTKKNLTALRTQAHDTFKSRGGPGLTKTGGNNERSFIADLLESMSFISNNNIELTRDVNVSFENNKIYIGTILPRLNNITFNLATARNGAVAKLVHQASNEPTIILPTNKLYKPTNIDAYDPLKYNMYIFQYIASGGDFRILMNRYTLIPN